MGCGAWGVGRGVWSVGSGAWGVGGGVWGVGSYHVGLQLGLFLVSIEDLAVGVAGPPTHPVVDLRFWVTGGPDVIRKEACPFYKTISGVRLCWELEEPKRP